MGIGVRLKGHFSRLAHQQSKFHASTPAQILTDLTLRVPPTAHTPYYYDTIGNVSTSHFRQGSTPASQQRSSKVKTSPRVVDGVFEIRPRYPLLGGWNYSFVVGYDMPLEDAVKVDEGRMILGVPFLTGWKDLLVDEAELKIVLPEGARYVHSTPYLRSVLNSCRDVKVHTPFPIDNIIHSITYLDSTGRHTITLFKNHVTENHAQTVYVTYQYPMAASLQKPLTVATVVGGLFVLVMGLRRVDFGFERRK
jgi:oligosaccharyltransferase complex subunit alpha (ribophorin I)